MEDYDKNQAAIPHPGVSPLSSPYRSTDEEGDGTHPTSPPRELVSTNLASPAETLGFTNPSSAAQTTISTNPAKKGIVVSWLQGKRKRGRPPKHQTVPKREPQSSSHTHPCIQPATQMEAGRETMLSNPQAPEEHCQAPDAKTEAWTEVSIRSPCSKDGCMVPEASELTSPPGDIQRFREGQSKNRPNLSSASVGQGDTIRTNVLTVDKHTDLQATEVRAVEHEATGTGIVFRKRIRAQRILFQSPLRLVDKKKQPRKVNDGLQQTDTVRDGVNISKYVRSINAEQETCESNETLRRKRKYVKRTPIRKVDQPARQEIKTSVNSPTLKVDQSPETVRKRIYPSKCKTLEVDQSEYLTKSKIVSETSQTNKVNQPQLSSTKTKYVSKTSTNSKAELSQEFVTKRKKASKIPVTHEVDKSQETVKKRKNTNKSNSLKTWSKEIIEFGKHTTKKPQSKKETTEQAASMKSQSHMVGKSLGVGRSQKKGRKGINTRENTQEAVINADNNTSMKQSDTVDQETVMLEEKLSKTSRKKEVQSLETDQSLEGITKNRKSTRKSQRLKDVLDIPSLIPVLSGDLPSPMLNSSGIPKRKYRKQSATHTLFSDVSLGPVLSADVSPSPSPPGLLLSPNTPKRSRGRPLKVQQQLPLSSTPNPLRRYIGGTDSPFPVSLSPLRLRSKRVAHENALPLPPRKLMETDTHQKTDQPDAALPRVKRQGRLRLRNAGAKTKAVVEEGSEAGRPAKRRRRNGKGLTVEESDLQSDDTTGADPHRRYRPRFVLEESDSPDKDRGDSSLSSDLSIELSLKEDHVTSLSLEVEEEEEQEDEEDLPSFLNYTKPLPITEGICVWCKFRNYPFWPALVKRVNRKLKKASIVFIDNLLLDKKKIRKGFSVALKTLKPFDCEEADELVCKAKEKYDAAINWCLELIADYRIRMGCGFTGSFIEYFYDDISCPVRKRYPQGPSDLAFPSNLMLEEQHVTLNTEEEEEEEEESHRQERKLLPDRSKAARNRANEKLVAFIVRQRQVETRLLGVISGRQQSKWLRGLLAASRSVVDTYLEDEEQLDQVIKYLKEVYHTASKTAPCLADVDPIRFVLDVLLPEAVIHAIAGVDKLSLKAAEDKYLKGPCLSKREREEFDAMIEQQMKMKASVRQCPAPST